MLIFHSLGRTLSPIALHTELGGTTDGTVTVSQSLDSANAEFGSSIQFGPNTYGPGAFAAELGTVGPILGNNPFSLSQSVTIVHTNAGDITSFDSLVQANAVPEPGTMMLMGSGLVGLGFWRRFKK